MAPWRNPEKASETRAERPSGAEGRVRLERQMATSQILAFTLRMMGAFSNPSKLSLWSNILAVRRRS